jgi:FAD synthase
MEVHFYRRLRDERKFPSAEALKAQIQKDVQRSLNFFRLLKLFQERQTQRTVS